LKLLNETENDILIILSNARFFSILFYSNVNIFQSKNQTTEIGMRKKKEYYWQYIIDVFKKFKKRIEV